MERIWLIDISLCSNRKGFGMLQYKAMKEFGEEGKYTENECQEVLKYLRRQVYNKKEGWFHFRKRIFKNIKEVLIKKYG